MGENLMAQDFFVIRIFINRDWLIEFLCVKMILA